MNDETAKVLIRVRATLTPSRRGGDVVVADGDEGAPLAHPQQVAS